MNWIAAGLIILGYLLVIWRLRAGFILQIVGCSIYILDLWYVDSSVVFVNTVFWIVNLIGFIKWSKDNVGQQR